MRDWRADRAGGYPLVNYNQGTNGSILLMYSEAHNVFGQLCKGPSRKKVTSISMQELLCFLRLKRKQVADNHNSIDYVSVTNLKTIWTLNIYSMFKLH